MLNERTSVLYQTRYCAQKDFSIAVCMNKSLKIIESPFSLNDYGSSNQLCALYTHNSKVVTGGSDLYFISNSWPSCTFKKYPKSSKTFNILPPLLDERDDFHVCSFMQKIFVVGGYVTNERSSFRMSGYCVCYDKKRNKWAYIASMIETKINVSCAVFDGKLVVTGGRIKKEDDAVLTSVKSVEAYNFHENKWTQLPDMLNERCFHSAVSIGNKLFVIGGRNSTTCEMFDSETNKFAYVKDVQHIENIGRFQLHFHAVTLGNNIYVFKEKTESYLKDENIFSSFCYELEQKNWISLGSCKFKRFRVFCCVSA